MRVLLRTLAPLLGLALAAAGVLLVVEVVGAWVRPAATGGLVVPWQDWQATLSEVDWTSPTVRIVAVCVGVLGLLLVLVAVLARRHDVALTSPAAAMTVATSPQVLARLVGRHVRDADDVAAAVVSASARRVSVRVEGWPDAEGGLAGLRDTVRTRVDVLLAGLPLATTPRVTVTTRIRRELR